MPQVTNFLPSLSGFKFINAFPAGTPHYTIPVLGQSVTIGDAANGLCGGMVYAVRDYFENGMPIPSVQRSPTSGVLFDYIVKRLYDSFNLPFGPTKYIALMSPALPDHETWASQLGTTPHGRAWIMINEEWPKIKNDIDNNRLSCIALVQIKSNNILELGGNHQVLVYGYSFNGIMATLNIYDPNYPNDNGVTISLDIGNAGHTTLVQRSHGGTPIYCFFRTDYTRNSPPHIADAKTNYDLAAAAAKIKQLYQQVLERQVDDGGLIYWGSKLDRGEATVKEIVKEVGKSQEYFQRFVQPHLSNGVYVAAELMSKHFLARVSANPQDNLLRGEEIKNMGWQFSVDAFIESPEYAARFGDDNVPN